MKHLQLLTYFKDKVLKVQNDFINGRTNSSTRVQYRTSDNGLKCCSDADRVQFRRAADVVLLIPTLLSTPLLTVNSTEGLATAVHPGPPPSIAGIALLFGVGLLCWAVCGPIKSCLNSFTKSHGPHPKAAGGDSRSGTPGKPGAGGGDPTTATPGKLGPGGHEYAQPTNPKELAKSIGDSFGVGQPPADLHPETVTRQSCPAEYIYKPPVKPTYSDGHYFLQDDGTVDPLIIKQIMRLLHEGLPSDPSRDDAKLAGIRRLVYNDAGVLVETVNSRTGLFEQTILPKQLLHEFSHRYIPPGANWYEYPQELLPVVEQLLPLTTREMIAASIAVVFLPGVPVLLYRAWIGHSEYFRFRIRSRFVGKSGSLAFDYLAVQ